MRSDMSTVDPMTDDDVDALRKLNESMERSVPLSRRGLGSLVLVFRESGLVKMSYRSTIGKRRFSKVGYHISCQSEFLSRFPNDKFLSLDSALIEAERIALRGEIDSDFRDVHVTYRHQNKEQKKDYAKVWEVLQGYRKSMRGRESFKDIRTRFRKHLFRPRLSGKRRFKNFLFMEARHARPEHLLPTITYMAKTLKLTTQCNRLISDVSAAFSWASDYEQDALKELDSIDRRFGIERNYFKSMKKYSEFEKAGKYQLSDRELWLIWHEGIESMGLVGRFARCLIAMGGLRQEHLLKAGWGDFEFDSVYPNIELLSKKTGMKAGFEAKPYSCAMTSLALFDFIQLRDQSGSHVFIFPARQRADNAFDAPKHRDKGSLDKPFKRLQQHVFLKYGLEIPVFSMGQLRGTITTRMGVAGIPKAMRNLIQHHNQRDVSEIHYNRYKDLREKTEALGKWDAYLRDLFSKDFTEVFDDYPEEEKASESRPAQVVARPL